MCERGHGARRHRHICRAGAVGRHYPRLVAPLGTPKHGVFPGAGRRPSLLAPTHPSLHSSRYRNASPVITFLFPRLLGYAFAAPPGRGSPSVLVPRKPGKPSIVGEAQAGAGRRRAACRVLREAAQPCPAPPRVPRDDRRSRSGNALVRAPRQTVRKAENARGRQGGVASGRATTSRQSESANVGR